MNQSSTDNNSLSTLFVGGLSFNIQENDLYNYFSTFGPIKKVNLLRRKDNGLSKGFAFVFFREVHGLMRVIEAEDHYILGRKLDCQRA
jgi:RNA recognition motif-containing protein